MPNTNGVAYRSPGYGVKRLPREPYLSLPTTLNGLRNQVACQIQLRTGRQPIVEGTGSVPSPQQTWLEAGKLPVPDYRLHPNAANADGIRRMPATFWACQDHPTLGGSHSRHLSKHGQSPTLAPFLKAKS